jgi:hypothetical protein
MSNAEFPNYYPYINSSNEDFFREVEKYLDNATPQNKSDLPPQAVPELTIDQYSNEIDSQQELRDPIIFGLMGIIKVNKSNEENINKIAIYQDDSICLTFITDSKISWLVAHHNNMA